MYRGGAIATLGALGAMLVPAAAGATPPGQLDPSFGGGTVLAPAGVQLLGTAARPDGSVVAAGTDGSQAQVAQYTSGGALASTSSGAGAAARGVAIQGDGKIVVAGGDEGGSTGMVVERFTPDGSPDPSFGSGGVVTLLPNLNAQANAVALQSDGEIVVAGTATSSSFYPGVALARLNPANGHVDSSRVFDLGHFSTANSIAVQADNKIVIGGSVRDPGNQVTAVMAARFNADGNSPDGSFNNGGEFVNQYAINGAAFSAAYGVALQSDGKVVLAGMGYDGNTGANMVVVRLTAAGSADGSFGSGGAARAPATANGPSFSQIPPLPGAHGVVVVGGKIVAAGYAYDIYGFKKLQLWALTPSGALDSTFGNGGIAGGQSGQALAIAPAPGANLIVAGDTGERVPPPTSALVARYGTPTPVPPPSGAPPSVTIGAPSQVTEVSATANGQVNPNGLATSYHFEYGKTTAYGSSTTTASTGAGTSYMAVAAVLTGLSPNTTYHYRLVATNADGTSKSTDATFTTAPARPPAASTGGSSKITEVSAMIAGQVTPNGLATSYHFDYGQSTAYGSTTRTASVPASSPVAVSATLRGLRPGTTYHYRLAARNANGTSYGRDQKFTTTSRLSVTLSGLARSYRISDVIKRGLALRVGCNQACSIAGALLPPISSSKRRGHRPARRHHVAIQLPIGGGTALLRRAGTATLTLRLSDAGERALATVKKLTVTLRIVVTPVGGGPTVTLTRPLAFKR